MKLESLSWVDRELIRRERRDHGQAREMRKAEDRGLRKREDREKEQREREKSERDKRELR